MSSSPKKTHQKRLFEAVSNFSNESPCVPNPRFWGDGSSPVSHTAAFWLERSHLPRALDLFGGFRHEKKDDLVKVKVLPGRSLVGEMELPHSLIVFIYCIYIIYIYNIFFLDIVLFMKSQNTLGNLISC